MEASAIAKKGCQNDLMTVSTLEHLSSQMRFMRVQTAQMMCVFFGRAKATQTWKPSMEVQQG